MNFSECLFFGRGESGVITADEYIIVFVESVNTLSTSRGRAVAARQAHNLEVAGSNPAPATKKRTRHQSGFFLGT